MHIRVEPINPAFLAVQAETGKALDSLARVELTDEDVHGARKALKKARASLRLLRPVLGDAGYREANAALRDAGRGLSPLRDAAVLLHALDGLARDAADDAARNAVAPIHRALTARWAAARDAVLTLESRRRSAALIEGTRQLLARQALAQAGGDVLLAGLRRIYRKARKAFASARDDTSAATLHEWRKQTKYLYNAAAALRQAHAGGLRDTEQSAGDIADWLGDDHDLAVLGDVVRTNNDAGRADSEALLRRIVSRRARLQQRALAAGVALFAAKPERFGDGIAVVPHHAHAPAAGPAACAAAR